MGLNQDEECCSTKRGGQRRWCGVWKEGMKVKGVKVACLVSFSCSSVLLCGSAEVMLSSCNPLSLRLGLWWDSV